MINKQIIEEIRSLKQQIEEAKKLKCTCDSVGFIYNQGCYCSKGKVLHPLQDKLSSLIKSI